MKFYILLLALFSPGCIDFMDQHDIKIEKNIYALHSAGIDGYSIARKISATGYVPIIAECVVAVYYNEDFTNMLVKRVESLNSTDTTYLNYTISADVLNTISKEEFYSSILNYRKKKVLLPPKD